jgi:hypothetical protein
MQRPSSLLAVAIATAAVLCMAGCTGGASPAPTAPSQQSPAPVTVEATPAVTAPDDPVPSASATPQWPTGISEVDAMSSPQNYTVVWLAVSDDVAAFEPVLARTTELGYSTATTPLRCVYAAGDESADDDGGDVLGLPLYFATRAEADTFVALWATPVVTVVDDVHLACDWG